MVPVHNVNTTTVWKWFPSPSGEIYTVLGLLIELLIPWAGFSVGICLSKNKCWETSKLMHKLQKTSKLPVNGLSLRLKLIGAIISE